MAKARQAGGTRAGQRVRADLIAPEGRGHVVHFRPVFSDMKIVDAEYEDIVPAETTGNGEASRSDCRETGDRFDAASGSLAFFGRRFRVGAQEKERTPGLFHVAAALLCALSFWAFGGHTVFAGLTDRDVKPAAVAGNETPAVDGIVTGTISAMRPDLPTAANARPADGVIVVDRSGGPN